MISKLWNGIQGLWLVRIIGYNNLNCLIFYLKYSKLERFHPHFFLPISFIYYLYSFKKGQNEKIQLIFLISSANQDKNSHVCNLLSDSQNRRH